MIDDLTALTHWFPLLDAAGLPVPKTRILMMPVGAQECILAGFEGNDGTPKQRADLRKFIGLLQAAVATVGGPPAFLRTAHTSDKHSWDRSCFIDAESSMMQHVLNLAEASEIIGGIMGLPWDTWVVREFLPTIPWTTCPNYGGMPVCREYRVFVVEEGRVCCLHPYWPEDALITGGADIDYDAFITLTSDELAALIDLAKRAGRAVPGAWSVDILETQRGWMITDMAEAHKSWHEWPECPQHYD